MEAHGDREIHYGFRSILPGFHCKSSFDKGLALVKANHVLNVKELVVNNHSIIYGKIVRQTSVSLPAYTVTLELDRNREATIRTCECAAGAGTICKHISALIQYINLHGGESKTDNPQAWGKPTVTHQLLKEKYAKGNRIDNLYPLPKKFRFENLQPYNLTSHDLIGIPCALRDLLHEEEQTESVLVCKQILNNIVSETIVELHKLYTKNAVQELINCQQQQQVIGELDSNLEFLDECSKSFFKENINADIDSVIKIAVDTVAQSECPQWFTERKFRISASTKAHSIKTRRKDFEQLAQRLANPKSFRGNASTKYGIAMEKTASSIYEKTYNCKVIECGLVIHHRQSWLCASPDGLVKESSGKIGKVLEIKCPKTCEDKEIASENGQINVPYIERTANGLIVKTNNMYYTQCQLLMYVTGLPICDFFVYSPKQQILITVLRDTSFLENLLRKMEHFYLGFFLPLLSKPIDATLAATDVNAVFVPNKMYN